MPLKWLSKHKINQAPSGAFKSLNNEEIQLLRTQRAGDSRQTKFNFNDRLIHLLFCDGDLQFLSEMMKPIKINQDHYRMNSLTVVWNITRHYGYWFIEDDHNIYPQMPYQDIYEFKNDAEQAIPKITDQFFNK